MGELEATIQTEGLGLAWGTVTWAGGGAGGAACADTLQLGSLFAARLNARKTLFSHECSLRGSPELSDDGSAFSASLDCPKGPQVEFSVRLDTLSRSGGVALRTRVSLMGSRVSRLAALLLHQGSCVKANSTGSVDGSPVRVGGGRFLLAVEHPLGKHRFGGETRAWVKSPEHAVVAEVAHLDNITQRVNGSLQYGAVIVAVADPQSQCRRTFAEYLRVARPEGAWQGPLVHYNSWYDFTSWQDEGFFKEHPRLLAQLRREPMNELGALQRVSAFEPLVQRGVKLDSFLWDDGWDDPHALWTFDRRKFPDGFSNVASRAKELGAGLSVWLSPWGGYGQAKDERVQLGREQGFETNDHGLSLAGPKYSSRFKAAVHDFRRAAHVNMFKFDGVAGDPNELAAEVEGMLSIVADLRDESQPSREAEAQVPIGHADDGEEEGPKKGDPFWINLTTGTWPSPFFLLWVDSIWRGLTDTHVPDWRALKGLSRRQRWQVWRECVVHELVVKRAELFPIARLMVHGAVLAGHGDALANGLHTLEPFDWAQEVWSLAAMGLQLQELYISAKFMSDWSWDELAAALRWARENSDVLEDAHWAVPANCIAAQEKKKFKPYAIGAWRSGASTGVSSATGGGRGFLFLRNPRNKTQSVPRFTLAEALELPAATASGHFVLETVRRVGAFLAASEQEALDCSTLAASAEELSWGKCAVAADVPLRFSMSAGELLVLRADDTVSR